MTHARSCPASVSKAPCTCGAVAPTPQVLPHADHCPKRFERAANCTCAIPPVPGGVTEQLPAADAPKDTDDNPYRDIERSRELAKRAEAAATDGNEPLAAFLLELAREARLLAELQGKWEY